MISLVYRNLEIEPRANPSLSPPPALALVSGAGSALMAKKMPPPEAFTPETSSSTGNASSSGREVAPLSSSRASTAAAHSSVSRGSTFPPDHALKLDQPTPLYLVVVLIRTPRNQLEDMIEMKPYRRVIFDPSSLGSSRNGTEETTPNSVGDPDEKHPGLHGLGTVLSSPSFSIKNGEFMDLPSLGVPRLPFRSAVDEIESYFAYLNRSRRILILTSRVFICSLLDRAQISFIIQKNLLM
ncbi:unnamed protein product [Arabis nemorensis]|uniref:Uncharacterized protein n=1 Tax=Arabis nemorensis TaxID=586526 RepID=A0A565CNS9_9BRAS|nr:unnamed protein product [Arabis nemorensis]